MSRLIFVSPSGGAELWGGEIIHLRDLASAPGRAALEITSRHHGLEACERLLAFHPEPPAGQHGANHLHVALRAAQEEARSNRQSLASAPTLHHKLSAPWSNEALNRLMTSVDTSLVIGGLDLVVAGVHLHTTNLILNAALVAGSDPVRLAAKLAGHGSQHLRIDGPDRAWLAGIIRQGVGHGLYRNEFWGGSADPNSADRKLVKVGWLDIADWLCERDDEPVVTYDNGDDYFPSWEIAGSPQFEVPADWRPQFWSEEDWLDLTEQDRADRRSEYPREAFDQLPAERQWEMALAGLNQTRPWSHLTPASLAGQWFSYPVSVFDLIAPDRDERVRAAVAKAGE